MAKQTKPTVETLSSRIDELDERLTKLEAGGATEAAAPDAVSIPTPDDVASLDKKAAAALAVQLGIDTDGVNPKVLKSLLATAAAIHHDEGVEDLDEDAVNALAEALGLTASAKTAKTIAALKKYLEAAKDTEADSGNEDSEDEDESDSEDEEEEEDEKPAKKKKKAADDDEDEEESEDEDEEEEEEEESDDEDEDEDEKPAKKKKKAADDDDEDEDEEESEDEESDEESEDAPVFTAKHVAAYNKANPKKPVKNAAALAKACTDDEGTVHAWGTAYVKGDTAYCCGLPLKDTKAVVDGEKIEVGKCLASGKLFKQDDDGELVEVEAD